jgi:cytochrome c biogenesis protein CcdA
MKPAQLKLLSNLCFILGFASVLGSIAVWFLTGGQAADTHAHARQHAPRGSV